MTVNGYTCTSYSISLSFPSLWHVAAWPLEDTYILKELLALEVASGTKLSLNHLDHSNQFLPVEAWDPILRSHPNQTFIEFLHRGIEYGFCISFDRSHKLKPCKGNLLSTKLNSVQVDNYIADEVTTGKLI